jgi:hypothetical protein
MDSGASYHLTGLRNDLINLRTISPRTFTVADGGSMTITTVGDLRIQMLVETGSQSRFHDIVVPNVYYVPTLPITLLSVFRIVQAGNHVVFDSSSWIITKGRANQVVLRATPVDGVYEVQTPASGGAAQMEAAATFPRPAHNLSRSWCGIGVSDTCTTTRFGPSPRALLSMALFLTTVRTRRLAYRARAPKSRKLLRRRNARVVATRPTAWVTWTSQDQWKSRATVTSTNWSRCGGTTCKCTA